MTKSLIQRVLAIRQDCAYCGQVCSFEDYGPRFATTDHIVPRSRGGTNARKNKTLACLSCNRAKQARRDWAAPAYTYADVLPVEQVGRDDDEYPDYNDDL